MDRNAVPTERWFWWQQSRVVIRAQCEEVEGETFLEGTSPRRGEGRKQGRAEMEGTLEGHSLTWAGVRPALQGPGPSPLPRLPSVS